MAKFINSRIKSGRLAGSVFAVVGGETIERAYNPFVRNPQTLAQVQNRAKFKLLSQFAAIAGTYIAIPRVRNVSSRNRFISLNFGNTTFNTSTNAAEVNLTSIQLTASAVAMPEISATRGENAITVALTSSAVAATLDVDRVVYVAFERQLDEKLRSIGSVVSTLKEGSYSATFPVTTNAVVIYAYGVRDNNDVATATFSSLSAPTALSIAQLITSRTLTEADVTLTETRATLLSAAA